MKTTISRRAVLRGGLMGGVLTVGLPRLEAMLNGNGTAYAAGGALPKRYGLWAWSNGVHLAAWVPKTTGTGWELTEQLKPLAASREYVSVVSGTETKYGVGMGHCWGHTNLLTGLAVQGRGGNAYTAGGPSIDQLIAKEIAGDTRFKSIELGVDNGFPWEKGSAMRFFSHNGPNSPNVPIFSCRDAFNRLFAMGVPGGGAAAPSADTLAAAAAARKRVVDVLREDASALSKSLGTRDRARLAQHMEGIDAIERGVRSMGGPGAGPLGGSCRRPVEPDASLVNQTVETYNNLVGFDGLQANLDLVSTKINKTMAELLAVALACDLTRVFTFQYSPPSTRSKIPSLGVTGDYHGLTHGERFVNGVQPKCGEVVKFYMRELAVMLDVFKATPDGTGNLLDSCAILGTTDVAQGLDHSVQNYPMLVMGKAGGALKPGVHYRSTTKEVACKVPLTLARAVGAALPSFGGDVQRVTEGIPDLLA